MRILVLCPMKRECEIFRNSCHPKVHEYVTICCGVGKSNAAAECAKGIINYQPDIVAVIGYAAGTLRFKVGDFIAPGIAEYHDTVTKGYVPELEKPYQLLGHDNDTWILTGDRFVDADFINSYCGAASNAKYLFDMETAAIAHIASKMNVPTICLKLVSDTPQAGDDVDAFERFVNSHTDFSQFVEYMENNL